MTKDRKEALTPTHYLLSNPAYESDGQEWLHLHHPRELVFFFKLIEMFKFMPPVWKTMSTCVTGTG